MSHDRGCPCGKEPHEYEDCRLQECMKRPVGPGYIGLTREDMDMAVTKEQAEREMANSRQVGGNHYKKGEGDQHWDIVDRYHVPYLEGVGSKYPLRWRDKGGVEDLEKSLHYIDKILERDDDDPRWARRPSSKQLEDIRTLIVSHGHFTSSTEGQVAEQLLCGGNRQAYERVRRELSQYVSKIRGTTDQGQPKTSDDSVHDEQEETVRSLEANVVVHRHHVHIVMPENSNGHIEQVGETLKAWWGPK